MGTTKIKTKTQTSPGDRARLAAWREARVQNYMRTRSLESLASMLVDLEDAGGHVPEFEMDEEWPEGVRDLRAS